MKKFDIVLKTIITVVLIVIAIELGIIICNENKKADNITVGTLTVSDAIELDGDLELNGSIELSGDIKVAGNVLS